MQREADREVERLASVLGLSETQKDRVFGIVAGTSPLFNDSMRVVTGETAVPDDGAGSDPDTSGATTAPLPSIPPEVPAGDRKTAREEMIHQALDSERQQALEEYVADQDAWWDEFVRQREDELLAAAPAPASAPTGDSLSSDPAPDYGGNAVPGLPGSSPTAIPGPAPSRGKATGKQSFSLPPAGPTAAP